jgi:hypothetical protein
MWVDTDKGWLNLDHVLRIVRGRKENGRRHYQAYAADGASGYFELSEARDLEEILFPIIPAAPGVLAHFLYFDDDNLDEPPLVEVFPVIGWRCHQELERHPVLPADQDFEGVCALEMPDGRFYLPYENSYANREAWIEDARKQAKAKKPEGSVSG